MEVTLGSREKPDFGSSAKFQRFCSPEIPGAGIAGSWPRSLDGSLPFLSSAQLASLPPAFLSVIA